MNLEETPLYSCRIITREGSRKRILVITFKANLRNDNWSWYFGRIQTLLENREYRNTQIEIEKFDDVTFDLTACHWIDPIPIMSITLAARIFKSSFRAAVNFRLAPLDKDSPLPTDKVLKFIATEGFLHQITTISDTIYLGDKKILKSEVQDLMYNLSKLDTKLNYSNCTVVKAQLAETKTLYYSKQTIENWLNDKLDEAKVGLLGKESDLAIQHVIYKIKILLDETLHNINQHAYNAAEAWASIYVRFRHGTRNKSLSLEERLDLQKNIRAEAKACPRLQAQFAEENNGFVEVFILDAGMGMSSTYSGKPTAIEFRNALDEIFNQGKRRPSSEKRNLTARGGLNLMYDLLQQDHDYICGYSDSQWIGDIVPFDQIKFLYKNSETEKANCAKGLCWIVRLSMNSSIYVNAHDWKTWVGTLLDNPSFQGYKDDKIPFDELEYFNISDNRFEESKIKKTGAAVSAKNVRTDFKDVIIIFNRPFITKIEVWNTIDKVLSSYPPLKNKATRVLIIADIPEKEALTYAAALIQAKIYDTKGAWTLKISDIILVTQKLYVCALQKESSQKEAEHSTDNLSFTKDELYTNQYIHAINFSKEQHANPANSIREYINFIKTYDSWLFWNAAKNHPLKKYLFINQDIPWSEPDIKISGFLNFSLTLTQKVFTQLYKLALLRCYGLFHNKIAIIRNSDDLTIKLREEFNNNLEYIDPQRTYTIYLGSVFGSGTNEADTLTTYPKDTQDLLANFFIHSGVNHSRARIALFFWPGKKDLPEYEFEEYSAPFRRIGKTHAIAKYGWKYFPLPRYDDDGNSFYIRNPRETYTDWQSINNAIVSFGNVSYQGYTDLLKVDIKKALEFGFKYKTELARFLVTEFAAALNVNEADFNVKEFIPKKVATLAYADSREFYESIGIIVYPNHLNTSIAIEHIQSCLGNIDADNRLIPIDFTQEYHDSNAYLISPLTLDRIRDALTKQQTEYKKKNVLFFDCTIVSGKTRKHIYHILEGFGATEIKTLTILDRSRLPYTLPKQNQIRAYWRLDIPRLSYGDFNPINSSLDEIGGMESLFTEPAKVRFNQWSKAWGNNTLGISSSQNGVEPSRLPSEAQQSKKFSIAKEPPHDQIGGVENQIDVVNSFGLCIFCAETHAMTGRQDLALKIIEDTSKQRRTLLPPSIIIELIASQLLLFPHDFSNDLRAKMLKQLFHASISIKDSDNHSALAAITLLRQDIRSIESLFQEIFRVQKLPDTTLNLDLRIAMEYLVSKFKLQKTFPISSYDSILIKNQNDSTWQIYKSFHSEIFGGKGTMHSRPILELFSSHPDTFTNKLQHALVSFSRLTSIFQTDIHEWYLRTQNFLFTHSTIISTMKACYHECLDVLTNNTEEFYLKFSSKTENETILFLQDVHKMLFLLIFDKTDSRVIRKVNTFIGSLIGKINKANWIQEANSKQVRRFDKAGPVILVSSYLSDYPDSYLGYEKIWMACDKLVQEEIENFLYNAIYSSDPFNDPNNTGDTRVANMWITIHYKAEFVTINFTNSIEHSNEEVIGRIQKGYKDAHRHCVFTKALGGNVCFPDCFPGTKTLTVSLTLPIL